MIRHGDVDHAAEMAEAQGVDAASLLRAGIVHHVVPELLDDGHDVAARSVAVAARWRSPRRRSADRARPERP